MGSWGLLIIETEFSIKLNIMAWPQLCFSSGPRKVEISHQTNTCKVKKNNSMADIRTSYNVQLSFTNQSVETMSLTPLVTMISFSSLCNPSPGSHWLTRSLSISLFVTPALAFLATNTLMGFYACVQTDHFSLVTSVAKLMPLI